MLGLASAVLAVAAAPAPAPARVPWDAPQALRARAAVKVVYGTVPCELPVREARVVEGRRRIVITLVGQPLAPGTRCAEVLESGCVEVRLRRRAGSRRIVDASGRRAFVDAATARRARAAGCRRVPVRR